MLSTWRYGVEINIQFYDFDQLSFVATLLTLLTLLTLQVVNLQSVA